MHGFAGGQSSAGCFDHTLIKSPSSASKLGSPLKLVKGTMCVTYCPQIARPRRSYLDARFSGLLSLTGRATQRVTPHSCKFVGMFV